MAEQKKQGQQPAAQTATQERPAAAGAKVVAGNQDVAVRAEQGANLVDVTDEQRAASTANRRGWFTDTQAVNIALKNCMRNANLLSPVLQIDHLPEGFGVSMRMVILNTVPPDSNGKGGGGHVYKPDNGSDELALTKTALDMVANAADVSWHPELSRRLDDHADADYCHFRSVGWFKQVDGKQRIITGEREIDFRPGSALAKAWSPGRLNKAREFILPLTESKARNRAVRTGLGIKAKYTPEEIARPFVMPVLVFDPGLIEDAETRKQLLMESARQHMGLSAQLYGPPAGAAQIEGPKGDAPKITDEAIEIHGAPAAGTVQPDPEDLAPGADGNATGPTVPAKDPWEGANQ